MRNPKNDGRFHIEEGTVQCYIVRYSPFYMRHFGRAEYDRYKPIMSDRLREKGNAIADALNTGAMSLPEAEKALDAIFF